MINEIVRISPYLTDRPTSSPFFLLLSYEETISNDSYNCLQIRDPSIFLLSQNFH